MGTKGLLAVMRHIEWMFPQPPKEGRFFLFHFGKVTADKGRIQTIFGSRDLKIL